MILFTPWRKFVAFYNRANVRSFLKDAADTSEKTFKDGVADGPKTGRIYRRKGRLHQASVGRARAEYPANDTGALRASIRSRVGTNEAEVGSNMFYSNFLREGTSRMVRRKMADDALTESLPSVRARMKAFAEWKR